jgi:hypothetical protein
MRSASVMDAQQGSKSWFGGWGVGGGGCGSALSFCTESWLG